VNRLDPLLSIRSAAEPLGIAPRTLRDLIARGEVEAVRIGGAIRIRTSTVEQLIEKGTGGVRASGEARLREFEPRP
jgi:excisionase family DNA binding protein